MLVAESIVEGPPERRFTLQEKRLERQQELNIAYQEKQEQYKRCIIEASYTRHDENLDGRRRHRFSGGSASENSSDEEDQALHKMQSERARRPGKMPRACVPPRNTCFMVYMPEPGANKSATSNSDQRRHARETRAGFAAADQDDEQGVGRPAAETTGGESGREEIDDANSV